MLTRTGLGVAVGAVLLAAFGLRWGYGEFVVLGLFALVLILVGFVMVRRPANLDGRRRSYSHRVRRGDAIEVLFDLSNSGAHAVAPLVLVDRLGLDEIEVPVPSTPAGGKETLHYEIRAHRRGVHRLGPVELRRQDPFGLVVGQRVLGAVDEVIVHPKVLRLGGSSGVDRNTDIEVTLRRASSDPLAGFQSLREYVRGDDTRTIHWPTTARVGRPMVREFMDPRRPVFTIVVTTDAGSHTEDDFEEAIDVAASLAAHVLRRNIDIVLRTTDRRHLGLVHPLRDETQLLDLLARVRRTSPEETESIARVLTFGWDDSVAIVITGPSPRGMSELRDLGDRVVPIRIGRGVASPVSFSGRMFAAQDAEGFAGLWTDIVR
ncbi:MAG: DUF58 domain-containing protein [Acidimicrobiia bacterium]